VSWGYGEDKRKEGGWLELEIPKIKI